MWKEKNLYLITKRNKFTTEIKIGIIEAIVIIRIKLSRIEFRVKELLRLYESKTERRHHIKDEYDFNNKPNYLE